MPLLLLLGHVANQSSWTLARIASRLLVHSIHRVVSLWVAVRLFARMFSGSIVRVFCDNMGVVQNWLSQSSPSSDPIQQIIKAISIELMGLGVYMVVEWIPTLDNVVPDFLSRQGIGAEEDLSRDIRLELASCTRYHVPQEWLAQAWALLQS